MGMYCVFYRDCVQHMCAGWSVHRVCVHRDLFTVCTGRSVFRGLCTGSVCTEIYSQCVQGGLCSGVCAQGLCAQRSIHSVYREVCVQGSVCRGVCAVSLCKGLCKGSLCRGSVLRICVQHIYSSFSQNTVAEIGNNGNKHQKLYYVKIKNSSNKTLPQWALNLGPQPFGSDAFLSELLSRVWTGTGVTPGKGPGTRDQGRNLGLGYPPPRWSTDWKHYLPHPSDADGNKASDANITIIVNSVCLWKTRKSLASASKRTFRNSSVL